MFGSGKFFEKLITFIQQGYIKLTKSDCKDSYVTGFLFQTNVLFILIYSSMNP